MAPEQPVPAAEPPTSEQLNQMWHTLVDARFICSNMQHVMSPISSMGECKVCVKLAALRSSWMGTPPNECLICHWEYDIENGTHMPHLLAGNGAYICEECFIRNQTVDSFGLTVEELRKAAESYKSALTSGMAKEPTPQENRESHVK